MTVKQPLALSLADRCASRYELHYAERGAISTELRRLHAENEALRKELRCAVTIIQDEYPEQQWSELRVPQMLSTLNGEMK